MELTLDEAKSYLRVSSNDDDTLITNLISSAEKLVQDVARFSDDEWSESDDSVSAKLRIAVLYTVAYLYEHREEADHRQLNLTLRALLFGTRKEGF